MARTISNHDDVIDSRDVIERIEELEDLTDPESFDAGDGPDQDDVDELAALRALADEASSSPDWEYGETMIRDSYFVEYAQQLADDIGAVEKEAAWPMQHIDWEAAAEHLRHDYMSVDFDGVRYWIRA